MINISSSERECFRCGNCCHVDMFAYITTDDIERWKKEGRDDILEHMYAHDIVWAGDIIVASTGSRLKSCVFLHWNGEYFSCGIYSTRPKVCRDYVPGSSELCPLFYKKTK